MRNLRIIVPLLIVAIGLWASYDNVLRDNADDVKAAEAAACKVKPCADRHQMTRMERHPFGQNLEFTWKDGTVNVTCARSAWLFGARTCASNP